MNGLHRTFTPRTIVVALLAGAALTVPPGSAGADGMFLDTVATDAVVETLIDASVDQDADGRRQAVTALGILDVRRAVPALVDALGDPVAGVRASAAWALGVLRDPQALEPLTRALRDDNASVRVAAAEALVTLHGINGSRAEDVCRMPRTRSTPRPRPRPSARPLPSPRPRLEPMRMARAGR